MPLLLTVPSFCFCPSQLRCRLLPHSFLLQQVQVHHTQMSKVSDVDRNPEKALNGEQTGRVLLVESMKVKQTSQQVLLKTGITEAQMNLDVRSTAGK